MRNVVDCLIARLALGYLPHAQATLLCVRSDRSLGFLQLDLDLGVGHGDWRGSGVGHRGDGGGGSGVGFVFLLDGGASEGRAAGVGRVGWFFGGGGALAGVSWGCCVWGLQSG